MKKHTWKRLLSGLLVCLLLLSVMPVLPAAAAATEIDLTGATVTVSSQIEGNSTWAPANAIDGNTSLGWSSDGPRSTPNYNEWIQVKLANPTSMNRVVLVPRYDHGGSGIDQFLCFPEDFTIQVSADGASWITVVEKTGYTATNKSGEVFDFNTNQANVQYIKVNATKLNHEGNETLSYRFQLMEMKAYNDPSATVTPDPVKISLTGATVTVSSENDTSTWAKENAIDGNTGKGWSSAGPRNTADYNEWIQVKLAEPTNMSRVVLVPRYGAGNDGVTQFLCFPEDFTIQVSADGANWTTVVEKTGYKASSQTGEVFDFSTDQANVQYIRVNATKLSHEGVKVSGSDVYSSFRFQLMELEAYYTPRTAQELANSITGLAIDYTNECVILPTLPGIKSVKIQSSSNTAAVALDGKVDVVRGGTSQVVLELTDDDNNTVTTRPLTVTVTGLLDSLTGAQKLTEVTASSAHSAWPESHLINGDKEYGFWSNGDEAADEVTVTVKLEAAATVNGVVLYPRKSPADSSGNTLFPKNFTISVSGDGENWTSVKTVSNYETSNSTEPQKFTFDDQANVQYVKLTITRGGVYVQLAEIEVLGRPRDETAAQAAEKLTVADPAYNDKKVELKGVSDLFTRTITAASPTGIIAADGTITWPEADTEVTLTIQVTSRLDETDTATVTRKVKVKTPANLQVEAAAATVTLIPCPGNTDTKITLPTLEGYTITIHASDKPTVVDTNGNITRSDTETCGVELTLKVTNNTTGASALTRPLLVPIYKTYVAPTMTEDEIAKARADYESKAYGLFVHYISQYNAWGGCVFADGEKVMDVDTLTKGFNAAQFAKDANDFGVEYVVLTVWHGDTRTLFPSMTNQRWRDDRRTTEGDKSYSDRDVIADLLDELDKYGIDLHLYTHPCDGHDFTNEDQALTGWNDSTGSYATWNQYINELYYEVCERYGTRIKGLWFDGMYNHVDSNNQLRLKATCKTFNPGMILTMNTGFTRGELDPASGYVGADYRSWEVNENMDYVNDMQFSRHQSAIVLGGLGWWATSAKTSTKIKQTAEELFRYTVAMSSISTSGGFLNSTGFYPEKDGLDMKGDYWMGNIRELLVSMNSSYLDPVKESVKNTSIGKAWPTPASKTVTVKDDKGNDKEKEVACNISDLSWGVSTESRDGQYIYLHVLKKQEGNTLTLPAPRDDTVLCRDAVILNFDKTTTTGVTVTKNGDGGYTITLPEGAQWSEVDTVIRVQRNTNVSVTGVTVAPTEVTLNVGDTADLTATVTPEDATDKTVTWSSGAADVARVENGKVTAVKKGTAQITVTTADGGKTATCTVTVNDPVGDVEALIAAIGEVDLTSKAKIEAAEGAYAALTEAQKALVSNHATLTAARTAYNKLAADKAAADAVIAKIDAIGNVTLNSRDAIDAAREAYDALNRDQKALVTNYDVLTAAEARYAQLKRQTALIIGTAISGGSEPKAQFPFTDVPESAWYYDEVKSAWENGLVDGTNGTEYRPENTLTVAQAIKLAAALHQLDNEGRVTLTNVRGYWYDSYVEYAVYYGIIEAKYAGYTLEQMNAAITRAEFVHIFHGAMSSYYACNAVADNAIPDVKSGDSYADEIYEFYRAGILTGSDGKGTFHPESQIKRSEVAAILIRMYDTNARQAISLG